MRLKRNINSPTTAVGRASAPSLRLDKGGFAMQRKMYKDVSDFKVGMSNLESAVTRGLMAGFHGNTTEDVGIMEGQGKEAVDASGFDVGKAVDETVMMLGKGDDVSKTKLYDNYLNSYTKGVKIGEQYAKDEVSGVVQHAQSIAQAQFLKDMESGNFVGASERANQAHAQVLKSAMDEENTTPVVKNMLNRYMSNPDAQERFINRYKEQEVQHIAKVNADNARKEISDTITASSDSKNIDIVSNLNDTMDKIEKSGALHLSKEDRKDIIIKGIETKYKNLYNDENATGTEVLDAIDDLNMPKGAEKEYGMKESERINKLYKDYPLDEYARTFYEKQLTAKLSHLQNKTYHEGDQYALGVTLGVYSMQDAFKFLDASYESKNLTEVQYEYLSNKVLGNESKKVAEAKRLRDLNAKNLHKQIYGSFKELTGALYTAEKNNMNRFKYNGREYNKTKVIQTVSATPYLSFTEKEKILRGVTGVNMDFVKAQDIAYGAINSGETDYEVGDELMKKFRESGYELSQKEENKIRKLFDDYKDGKYEIPYNVNTSDVILEKFQGVQSITNNNLKRQKLAELTKYFHSITNMPNTVKLKWQRSMKQLDEETYLKENEQANIANAGYDIYMEHVKSSQKAKKDDKVALLYKYTEVKKQFATAYKDAKTQKDKDALWDEFFKKDGKLDKALENEAITNAKANELNRNNLLDNSSKKRIDDKLYGKGIYLNPNSED